MLEQYRRAKEKKQKECIKVFEFLKSNLNCEENETMSKSECQIILDNFKYCEDIFKNMK